MTNRTQLADLLKGIAVLLMIQVHVIELFANDNVYNSHLGKVSLFLGGPAVAPVFMIIMGYFIAASQKPRLQLITRGFKIFCLGMLLNIALNLNLIISVNRGLLQIDLLPYFFGVDILQFAGIVIIIIALFKKIIEKSITLVMIGIILSAFLGHFLLNYIPDNLTLKYISGLCFGSTKWSYFPLFPWLSYPLAGIAYYLLEKRYGLTVMNKTSFKLMTGGIFLLFLVFTIKYGISISSDLSLYYHHGLYFVLWVILFLSFYMFFMKDVNHLLGETALFKYIKWLGGNVTTIYVIQWIIIGNTATEIYKSISSPLYLLVYCFAILLITSIICRFLIKIKEELKKNAV